MVCEGRKHGVGPPPTPCSTIPLPYLATVPKCYFTSGSQTSQSVAGDIIAVKSLKAVLANSATGLSKRSPKGPRRAYGTQPYTDSHRRSINVKQYKCRSPLQNYNTWQKYTP